MASKCHDEIAAVAQSFLIISKTSTLCECVYPWQSVPPDPRAVRVLIFVGQESYKLLPDSQWFTLTVRDCHTQSNFTECSFVDRNLCPNKVTKCSLWLQCQMILPPVRNLVFAECIAGGCICNCFAFGCQEKEKLQIVASPYTCWGNAPGLFRRLNTSRRR